VDGMKGRVDGLLPGAFSGEGVEMKEGPTIFMKTKDRKSGSQEGPTISMKIK